MKIDQYINELLFDHDCVIVTDLGGFIANYKPATINTALHVIAPPSKKLAFNASLKNNDGLLANHIAQRTLLNYMDACEVIREYVKESTNGMKTGQKLKIDKVGVLYLDQEERLQFLPDHHANYLVESFGLTPVHAPLIKRTVAEPDAAAETIKIRSISPAANTKKRERRPFKWNVLEMIPAAAVLAVLMMTPPVLKNFNTNLSTLLPFSRMNEYLEDFKGIQPEKKPVSIPYANPFEIPPSRLVQPQSMNPVVVPETENSVKDELSEPGVTLAATPELTPAPETAAPVSTSVSTIDVGQRSYYVIGGCFRAMKNAEKFVAEMKSKGMDAAIIGQNSSGLYMVSLFSSYSATQATDALPEIKSNVIESAWVYKK